MKNAPVVDDDKFEGILVMDEDEFFLRQLVESIPKKRPASPTTFVVRRPEVVIEDQLAPAAPSALERETMIKEWLRQNKSERVKVPAVPVIPVAKDSEVIVRSIEERPQRIEPKKEAPKAKPQAFSKKERVMQASPVTNVPKEEGVEVEVVENLKGDASAIPRLVNGQWKLGYDAEAAYNRDVRSYKLLTIDEERDLLRRYIETKDKGAWDKLVACNQRLVAMYARQYVNMYRVPFLDAVQEGNIGLMHAIRRYSFERECKLSTYATWWIKQAITRWIMDTNRTIRLPIHVNEILSKARKASLKLFKKFEREPTDEEVCEEIGISINRYRTAQEGLKQILSMDGSLKTDETDGDLLGDFIPDDRPLQDEQMHDQELSENVIGPALAALKPRQRFVIVMRFGLVGCTFEVPAIAKVMGLSINEVRELERVVLQKLDPPNDIVFDRRAAMEWLRHASRKALTPREELASILRYGIGAQESTLESIASRVGMTRERIRQIEAKALPILRKRMKQATLKVERQMGITTAGDEDVSAAEVRKGVY